MPVIVLFYLQLLIVWNRKHSNTLLCSSLLQEGNTPLFIAARRGPSDAAAIPDSVKAVKLLLERGADRSIKNHVSVSYAV